MKKFYLRKTVQILSIFLFFFLFSKIVFPPGRWPVNIYFRFDALFGITTTLTTFHFSLSLLPGIFLLFLIFLFGNFFCFWICPFGGIIDWINIILFRRKWRVNFTFPVFVKKIRFYLLGIIICLALLTPFVKIPYLTWIFDPFVILMRTLVLKKGWLLWFSGIIIVSIVFPRFWCNNICPLGCLYYIVGRKKFIKKK